MPKELSSGEQSFAFKHTGVTISLKLESKQMQTLNLMSNQ